MASRDRLPGDRARWDARYASMEQSGCPAKLLLDWLPRLRPGAALDLACGTGRNALALAQHGCRPVTGVDISAAGLRVAAAEAKARGLRLDLVCADLGTFQLPYEAFDLICVFRFLDRRLAPSVVAALRPGGTLIYQTFTVGQLELPSGPHHRAFLLEHGELQALFSELRPLHYAEGIRVEDGHRAAVAELVARR